MHSFIHEQWAGVRAHLQVLSMWPFIRELDKEESQQAPLVQQNGFGLAFHHCKKASKRHSQA
jgi:hypothetical protein